jgi:hypothetical protein
MNQSIYYACLMVFTSWFASCATSSVNLKKTKSASSRTISATERSLAPRLSESYELSSTKIKPDEYIKRRGGKARGAREL